MLSMDELKQDRDLLGRIDWEITPQEAFETYQLKSVGNWRSAAAGEVLYFYVSAWQGENKVFLVRRSLKHSQELAELPVPGELVRACLRDQEGSYIPRGQCPIDQPIRRWLRQNLGL